MPETWAQSGHNVAVPRITEPTVAAHRARRLDELLTAARDLVRENGPDAVSIAEVARRVGLSRPALYEYFSSRDELLAAILDDEIPRWQAELADAVAAAGSLSEQVEAHVRTQLRLARDEGHAAAAIAVHAVAEPALARILTAHRAILDPLTAALGKAGVDAPELRAYLVQGIVNAAVALIQRRAGNGDLAKPAMIADMAVRQALRGLN
jgi:AcrR family transcriptional regulator